MICSWILWIGTVLLAVSSLAWLVCALTSGYFKKEDAKYARRLALVADEMRRLQNENMDKFIGKWSNAAVLHLGRPADLIAPELRSELMEIIAYGNP